MHDQSDCEQDQEYDEENLGDPRSGTRNTAEAEEPRDESDDQKNQRPAQHLTTLLEA
jgi:hypothetical protein